MVLGCGCTLAVRPRISWLRVYSAPVAWSTDAPGFDTGELTHPCRADAARFFAYVAGIPNASRQLCCGAKPSSFRALALV